MKKRIAILFGIFAVIAIAVVMILIINNNAQDTELEENNVNDSFVAMTKSEFVDYIEPFIEESTAEIQVKELSETYVLDGKETKVMFEFKKINKSSEEAEDIMKKYDEIYKGTNLPPAQYFDDLSYEIYTMKVEYSAGVDNSFPILIQVDENGDSFYVNGQEYINRPYILATKKEGNVYTYVIGTLRDKTKDQICYMYTFPETTGNPAEMICLK